MWQERGEFCRAKAYLDLMQLASFRQEHRPWNGKSILLERGEMITSASALANRWRWTKSKVQRFLDSLRDEGRIIVSNLTKAVRITLCEYDTYNGDRVAEVPVIKSESQTGSQTSRRPVRTTSEEIGTYNGDRVAKRFANESQSESNITIEPLTKEPYLPFPLPLRNGVGSSGGVDVEDDMVSMTGINGQPAPAIPEQLAVPLEDNDEFASPSGKKDGAVLPSKGRDAEEIYVIYPNKRAPEAAYKAIEKAIAAKTRTLGSRESAVKYLKYRTQRFADAWAPAPEHRLPFRPYPATWFNAGGYDEDPEIWARDAAGRQSPRRRGEIGLTNRGDWSL